MTLTLTSSIPAVVIAFFIGLAVDEWVTHRWVPQQATDDWQQEYALMLIRLFAKLCKADNVVTRAEVRAFKNVIDYKKADEAAIAKVFNRAKSKSGNVEQLATRLADFVGYDTQTLKSIIIAMYYVSMANGYMPMPQRIFINRCAALFGLDESFVDEVARNLDPRGYQSETAYKAKTDPNFKNRNDKTNGHDSGGFTQQVPPSVEHFKLLGLKQDASVADIKKAYRKMLFKYHPDRLRGQGKSEKAVLAAEAQMARINAAYTQLMQHHSE